MGNIAIRVSGLRKRYQIGVKQQEYETFRETLVSLVMAPFRRFSRLRGTKILDDELIWALKDISFEVRHGEVLGLIGRNGAGKTTLLRILTRITWPTEGRAEVFGRVGSLLEVGTGFHPELTGRENVYLNGALLGMKKAEIDRKFDEIVAFSGIETFLDTPVKRYSSGMYVRPGVFGGRSFGAGNSPGGRGTGRRRYGVSKEMPGKDGRCRERRENGPLRFPQPGSRSESLHTSHRPGREECSSTMQSQRMPLSTILLR